MVIFMEKTNLRKDSWCIQCVGCDLSKEKDFAGKKNCGIFKAADKKVWCADEAVTSFNKTAKIK